MRSQTAYARMHQQPQHMPNTAKKGVKIVSWNVNGLRAVLKKTGGLVAYADAEAPDILCLNETKIDASIVPSLRSTLPGYHSYWECCTGKKGYSGVALFSRTVPLSVSYGIGVPEHDAEGRAITAEFDKYFVVATYVPNSGSERLVYRTQKWDVAMLKFLLALQAKKPVVWLGDLNVANEEIDLANPKGNRNKTAGFYDAEREAFKNVLSSGFVDSYRHLHPTESQYSYWGFRTNAKVSNSGWRVDYCVVSEALKDKVVDAFIRASVEGSDHVPVGIDLVL